MRSRACFWSIARLVKGGCDIVKEQLTISSKKSDGSSICTGTTSSTNTMNIILRIVRVVIVEHMSNIADIFIYGLARTDRVYSNVPAGK